MSRHRNATLPLPRRQGAPDEAERSVRHMRYRLQVWRESGAGFVTLAGYHALDPALEAGPKRSGKVRVVDKLGRVVVAWRNGRVTVEQEESAR